MLAVLSNGVFWSGLPAVLAAAAIALGLTAREAGDAKGNVAIGLGALALALDLVIYVLDMT